jgi:hypothetical protein
MKSVTIYSAVMVDDGAPLSVHEMACLCEQQIDWVVTLVREGFVGVERDVIGRSCASDCPRTERLRGQFGSCGADGRFDGRSQTVKNTA